MYSICIHIKMIFFICAYEGNFLHCVLGGWDIKVWIADCTQAITSINLKQQSVQNRVYKVKSVQ